MRFARAMTSVAWLSRIVAVLGLVGIASALSKPLHNRLHLVLDIVPPGTPAVADAATAASGVVLIVLSVGLRRRKHRAWLAATILVALSILLHLIKGLDVEEASLAAVVLALLIGGRGQFTAKPDPRSHRTTLITGAAALIVATGMGYLLLTLMHFQEAPSTTAWQRLQEALLGLFGLPGPIQFRTDEAQTRVFASLLVLGAAGVLATLAPALRPAGGPHPMDHEDRRRIRTLLAGHGGVDSLSYFATRNDRCAAFSPSGKAAVSFRVVGGVSIAGGDPVGDPEAWPQAIQEWLAQARGYGWAPAVLGASPWGAKVYARLGLSVLELGDEAILDTAAFSLQGRPMRAVRQAVGRVERAGYTVHLDRIADLEQSALEMLRRDAQAWRDGEVERGFSMALGRLAEPDDDNALLVRAVDGEGRLRGVLQLVPWGTDGLSLDVMRRDRASENGTVEAMVCALMSRAAEFGVKRVSLNFAVFRAVFERGERLGAGPIQRLQRNILLWASRFWQIEALYRANAKYQPLWSPRYLVYEEARDLPQVALAALRAEAFIVFPRWAQAVFR